MGLILLDHASTPMSYMANRQMPQIWLGVDGLMHLWWMAFFFCFEIPDENWDASCLSKHLDTALRHLGLRRVVGRLGRRRDNLGDADEVLGNVRSAPEKNTASDMDCMDSKRLSK